MRRVNTLIQQCLNPASQSNPVTKPPANHLRKRQTLTEAQRRYPLLRKALERVQQEASTRSGRYLRRLDCIHASGSRTHQQTWDAVGILINPMLARMDFPTLTLGWLDDNGELHLNRQRSLVEDSDLTPSRVSRTLHALEKAGYLYRVFIRLFISGKGWITRVAIRLRRQFFTDLGLAHELHQVLKHKQKQRIQQLQEAEAKRLQNKLIENNAKHQRKESHIKAQGKHRISQTEQSNRALQELLNKRNDLLLHLMSKYPELTEEQLKNFINQRYPLP